MKGWLFLVIAIVGEVIATSALKSSEGFILIGRPRGGLSRPAAWRTCVYTVVSAAR